MDLKVICIDEPAFLELVDKVVGYVKQEQDHFKNLWGDFQTFCYLFTNINHRRKVTFGIDLNGFSFQMLRNTHAVWFLLLFS